MEASARCSWSAGRRARHPRDILQGRGGLDADRYRSQSSHGAGVPAYGGLLPFASSLSRGDSSDSSSSLTIGPEPHPIFIEGVLSRCQSRRTHGTLRGAEALRLPARPAMAIVVVAVAGCPYRKVDSICTICSAKNARARSAGAGSTACRARWSSRASRSRSSCWSVSGAWSMLHIERRHDQRPERKGAAAAHRLTARRADAMLPSIARSKSGCVHCQASVPPPSPAIFRSSHGTLRRTEPGWTSRSLHET